MIVYRYIIYMIHLVF